MRLSEPLQELLLQMPNVPQQLAEAAVRTSVARLAQCCVFRADCDVIAERAGTRDYDLEFDADGQILKVVSVLRDGVKLESIPTARFMELAASTGVPTAFMRVGSVISLAPVPRENKRNAVQVAVHYTPARNAVDIDDAVGYKYFDTIVKGAKLALMEMPGQAWYSPTTAAGFRMQLELDYNNAVNDAKGLLDGKRIISGIR